MRFDKLEFNDERKKKSRRDEPRSAPKDEHHWIKLADENRRGGDYENALRFYSRALELDKSIVTAWVGQVQMLIQLSEFPQADMWSKKALELYPSEGDLLAARGQARCRMGDTKQAFALSDGALARQGDTAYRWMVRGEIMVAARKSSDQHCFDRAMQADTDRIVPLESALIYLYYKLPSKAQGRARTAVERAPDAYYGWYILGVSQSKLGLDAPARSSFEHCLELCPRHSEAQQRLAQMRSTLPLIGPLRRLFGGR